MKTADSKHSLLTPLSLEIERRVAAFEEAYRADAHADLAAFLPPVNHLLYGRILQELVCVDLEFAWSRGEQRRLEIYRPRFPQLFENPEHLREAVREEYRLRRAAGETPSPSEFGHRFGTRLYDSADLTSQMIPATDILDPAPASSDTIPGPGEMIAGFKLIELLGTGAFGKVYLARETGLAGRHVALKISTRFPGEAQTLARLQHSNIVPIFSVHRHGSLHLICMPWLGSTTFADLIFSIRGSASLPVSAQSMLTTLNDRARMTDTPDDPSNAPGLATRLLPSLRQLEQLSYLDAALCFGEQIAEGLEHAHVRGVLHRDLKPANILLADDGRPMLLDFNLAADDQLAPREAMSLGGTLRYMAPEVIEALQRGRGYADARADVYALGLILCELVTGRLPFLDGTKPAEIQQARLQAPLPIASLRADLPAGFISILEHCLAPNPVERYGTAAELAEDLRRERTHYPLKYAPNTSRMERLKKWSRRHPRLSSSAFLGTVAVATLAAMVALFVTRQQELNRLEAVNAQSVLRGERDAIRILLVAPDASRRSASEARQRSVAMLDRYDAWNSKSLDNGRLLRNLPPEERESARRDLGAVFAEYAAASRRLARYESHSAQKAELLRQSESAFEQAVALRSSRQDATGAILESLDRGQYRQTIEMIERAGDEVSPIAWYARGYAHFKLHEVLDAVRCCDVALVHAPGNVPILFQRGLALQTLSRWDAAIRDYSAVLAVDPGNCEAILNRSLCHLEQNDPAAAIRDLNQLEQLDSAPSRLFFIREQARRRAGDERGARADFQKGLATIPHDPVSWVARGRAKLRLTPPDAAGALQDFESAVDPVKGDDSLLSGWENIAEVLSERLNRIPEALKAQDRVVELHPHVSSARAGRAVLHARLKQAAEARDDIAAALKLNPDALSLYQCACAQLLLAESATDRNAGLLLLKDALRKDPQWAASMESDPDLKSVHGAAEFRKLLAAARTLQSQDTRPETQP